MKKIIICILSCFPFFIYGQEDADQQLAIQYYQNGEFEKARSLFDDIFDFEEDAEYLFEYYFKTLIELEEYRDAEKLVKKQIKKSESPYTYEVDLAYLYEIQNEENKAEKQFEKVIDDLPAYEPWIQRIANSLANRGKTELAIKAYREGRKILKDDEDLFAYQLASLYLDNKEYEKMFEEQLRLIKNDKQAYENIKEDIQELAMNKENYELFKKMLIEKIQDNPQEQIYVDFLSWLFIQNKDFYSALMQFKALDKRMNGNGREIMNLAKVCLKNRAYEVAESSYEYVLDQGPAHPYSYSARQGLLEVKYEKVTQTGNYSKADLQELEEGFESFVQSNIFRYDASGEVILKLAEIRAEYLNKVDEAINLLERFVDNVAVEGNRPLIARSKIAMGDYYILKGDSWESTLLYSQAEKMFKDHPIGHMAKFRNARLSFYRGEFDWAQAQLKVLKGSTSELIANDALNLSIMIQDNRGLDTSDKAMQMYARADFLIFKNRFASADSTLDSLLNRFPGHNLEDNIFMAKAKMQEEQHNYDSAAFLYQKVYDLYGNDILADDALFKTASLYDYQINDKAKAQELYEKLILDYKGSIFNVRARERFRELRGDAIN